MNKKILFFLGGNYYGGLEIVTLALIKGLKENGYECRCVISGWKVNETFINTLTCLNIKSYRVKLGWIYIHKVVWTIDTLLHYPQAYLKCKKILKDFNPDILHFIHYGAPILLYPLLNKNCVYTLHETHYPSFTNKWLYKLLNRKMNIFIAVSNHISNTLQNLNIPSSKIKLIYNGIIPPKNNDYVFDELENTKIQLGIVGQIAFWKGHEILLEAINILNTKRITNFHLQIFGNSINDSYLEKLENIIILKNLTNYITWRGFIANADDIYKSIHVVIIPSIVEESFSLTVAESMIRGKAIIISNKGGMLELISNGVNGLIFSSGNSNQLAECLELFITSKEKIYLFGLKAKEKAIDNYTYEIMTSNYIKAYQSII